VENVAEKMYHFADWSPRGRLTPRLSQYRDINSIIFQELGIRQLLTKQEFLSGYQHHDGGIMYVHYFDNVAIYC
jgi:hypothetical protein